MRACRTTGSPRSGDVRAGVHGRPRVDHAGASPGRRRGWMSRGSTARAARPDRERSAAHASARRRPRPGDRSTCWPTLADPAAHGLLPTACSAGRTATATGDHAGLNLRLDLSISAVRSWRGPSSRTPALSRSASTPTSAAGSPTSSSPGPRSSRRESADGLRRGRCKELVLRDQRSRQDPGAVRAARVGGGSESPIAPARTGR